MRPESASASSESPPPLDRRAALRLAARGWAWGFGASAVLGFVFVLAHPDSRAGEAPGGWLSVWAHVTAMIASFGLPLALSCVLAKALKGDLPARTTGHDHGERALLAGSTRVVVLYALATLAGFPLLWAGYGGFGVLIPALCALALYSFVLFFELLQRATGVTTAAFARRNGIAPIRPLRLDAHGIALLAGFVFCRAMQAFGGVAASVIGIDIFKGERPFHADLSFLRGWVAMLLVVSSILLGGALQRHFTSEPRLKLQAVFTTLMLLVGLGLYLLLGDILGGKGGWICVGFVGVAAYLFFLNMEPAARKPARKDTDG